jgi:predicted transcriptional regulator
MTAAKRATTGIGSALVLSIRPEHAARIFEGSKHYELRKIVPDLKFDRVFLYETGGKGIVGCFDVVEVLHLPVQKLWDVVGTAATTYERFSAYFQNSRTGFAIRIRNPLKFVTPVGAKELNGDFARLVPPQSFIVIDPGQPLYTVLEAARTGTLHAAPPVVTLAQIKKNQHDLFRKLVLKHISPHYADIDASFADRTLDVHQRGFDPAGFFTTKKEVLSIYSGKKCIGFTTLTYKSGGCVKSGPTVLFRDFRRKGYGLGTRKAIERHVVDQGVRKLYCTCPENAAATIKYLLSSGMRIEAHLERHYATTHNELVFGKLLVAEETGSFAVKEPSRRIAKVSEPEHFERRQLVSDFVEMFRATWRPVSRKIAADIIAQATHNETQLSKKPKRLTCLKRGEECVGAIALLPKRGGAVKGVLVRNTTDSSSLADLVNSATRIASGLGGRKLYFLHPVSDWFVIPVLRYLGFRAEGLIRAPYKPGQDVVVMAKFL